MHDQKYDFLYANLKQIAPIPESEWNVFTEYLKARNIKKGECFLKANEVAKDVGFIIQGAVRMYYMTPEGEEFNHVFKFENELIAGYVSLLTGEPSTYFIEALEDSLLFTIDYCDFVRFYDRHPCWERLGRIVAEVNFIDKYKRDYQFLIDDAATRYLKLLQEFPGIEKRVLQYHLASYLGVKASSLNRVIKKLKEDGLLSSE